MYTLERPHIFTHIYSFSSFCDIIFIGFSFDDEKEKLCAGGGERERKKKSAATHTRWVWPVLILTLWREQLSIRGQESAVRQKDFKLFLPVVIFLSFLRFSIRQKEKYFPVLSVWLSLVSRFEFFSRDLLNFFGEMQRGASSRQESKRAVIWFTAL